MRVIIIVLVAVIHVLLKCSLFINKDMTGCRFVSIFMLPYTKSNLSTVSTDVNINDIVFLSSQPASLCVSCLELYQQKKT